jgi:hypothetical protein
MGLLAAVWIAAAGCGGNDPCADSPCPNDARKTPAQYDQCVRDHQANQNAKCNAPNLNYELCTKAQVVCTSGGTTDGSATLTRINNNCKTELDAATCCAISFLCK